LGFYPVQPSFKVEKIDEDYTVHAQVVLPSGPVDLVDNHAKSYYLFQQDQLFFYWKNKTDLHWVEQFLPNGQQKVSAKEWPNYLQSTLLPLSKNYHVALDHVTQEKVKGVKPQLQILLKENGDYLFFEPLFVYQDIVVQKEDGPSVIQQLGDKLMILERDLAAEQTIGRDH